MKLPEVVRSLSQHQSAVSIEEVSLDEVFLRCLAVNIKAEYDNPPFSCSRWDGFALCAGSSSRGWLRIVQGREVVAGQVPDFRVKQGTCVPVMTGAVIPDGANAVVKREDTELAEDSVKILVPVLPGSGVIPQGNEWSRGDMVISSGTIVTPWAWVLLAETGCAKIKVYRKPLIGFLAIGSELALPGCDLTYGKRYAGGQYFLAGIARFFGCDVLDRGVVSDDPSAIESAICSLERCDLIVTVGGTGKGVRDYTGRVWKSLGAEILFDRVDIKPGMSSCGGMWNGKAWLSLPGGVIGGAAIFCEVLNGLMKKWFRRKEDVIPSASFTIGESFSFKGKQARAVWGYVEFHESMPIFFPHHGLKRFTHEKNGYILLPEETKSLKYATVQTGRLISLMTA
ncbi:MAG: molybdopterin molybdotransferase MoeA [Deltaproteobacteria bacterium]|nr:molybdopterin molybdotransferase MoeA [Deltaproteobacteria bacterium]MBW2069098.1 molybdopterin molybdotransferase MoeA [Deltaproteobacteria bacterium]